MLNWTSSLNVIVGVGNHAVFVDCLGLLVDLLEDIDVGVVLQIH